MKNYFDLKGQVAVVTSTDAVAPAEDITDDQFYNCQLM